MSASFPRRQFVTGLAAVGASALVKRAVAQTANGRVIDCHHHFLSPAYIKALAANESRNGVGRTPYFNLGVLKDYTPAKDIDLMDKEGVATCMLSCTTPGVWFGDPEESLAIAHEMNEFGARMMSDYKGRFGLFALLPLPAVDASLHELEYALDTLKADGIGLMTNYESHWIGDPMFRPVLDELNRRKAIVYTHPIEAPCCGPLMAGVNPTTIEYNTDTARTIFSLIGTDAATRYGDITFLFSHAGGTMPSLVERFGVGGPDNTNDNLKAPVERNSRLFHLKRFYYDTAQSTNIIQMQGLKAVVDTSHIVFGTDFPFNDAPRHLAGLEKCGFTAAELQGIRRDNALKLFPRFKGIA
jgi:6-methylsalicylate decarboxylase